MNCVLPPDLEAKRLAIAKRHNLSLFGLMLFVVGIPMMALLVRNTQSKCPRPMPVAAILAFAIPRIGLEFAGIVRIFKHDQQMCRELGFRCPYCQKPLYEPRSGMSLNGLFPKCHR